MAELPRNYFYFAKCLETGKVVEHQADEVCESASTIKLPILAALLKEAEKGDLSLRQPIFLKKEHYSHNGSGIINNFYRALPLSAYNLAFLMIVISDNIATNVLIELLGKDKINQYCREAGLNKTHLIMSRLTFPGEYRTSDARIGETTPREMASFIERLIRGELLDETHTKIVKKFMQTTQSSFFGRNLPTSKNSATKVKIRKFGNKTGACFYDAENLEVINDCGFMSVQSKTYIFSVYSSGQTNPTMQYSLDSFPRKDFAKISKKIYLELTKS